MSFYPNEITKRRRSPLCSVGASYSKSSLIFHGGYMARSREKHGRKQPREALSTTPNLPHEIIVLILSRLPVKSLCRFRCVSNSWLSIISSPQFAKTHLYLALNNNQWQRLIFWSHTNLYCIDWDSINDDDVSDKGLVVLDHPVKDSPILVSCHEILYSSNGLVCIIGYDLETLLVINPCTGESRRIPEGSLLDYSDLYSCPVGFGYASTSDDYKLVIIDYPVTGYRVIVHSLRSDNWHRIELACLARYHFSICIGGVLLGVLLNGAVHWPCVIEDDGNRKGLILAFDLEEETFREMSLPAPVLEFQLDDGDIANISVGVVNGCLCVDNHDDDHLWLMREYNNGESWTSISRGYVCLKKPFGFAKNGDALPEVIGELTLCNFEDGTHGIPVGPDFRVGTYIESLISPNAYVGR